MFWFIQIVVVSFVIIFILHNLYAFFKDTLTVPKMKDLVRRPQQKYDTLFRELRQELEYSKSTGNGGTANANANGGTANANGGTANANANANGGTANANANDAMKNELKRYLLELNAPEPQQQPSRPNSNFIELGSVYQ